MNSRRWLARASVLGLHLGLLAVLWGQRPTALAPTPRLTQVRLIPLTRPTPVTVPAPPPRTQPSARAILRAAPPEVAPLASSPDPSATPAPTPPLPEPAAAPEPTRSTTLRLALPLGAASAPRNPALSDPRANTHRLTFEEKIAQAMGGEHWEEERMGDGRTLFRRGDTCFNVYQSRLATIDPMNESAKPTLKSVGAPYKCR